MSTKLNADELAFVAAGSTHQYTAWRKGYAQAIREVAQPLADERDELREALEEMRNMFRPMVFSNGMHKSESIPVMFRDEFDAIVRSVLAKYPRP